MAKLPENYQKRSFYRFDVQIDLERLVDEFLAIPDDAWYASYWGEIHCSVGMLLLRGGSTGTERDFYADSVVNYPILDKLPYMKSFLTADGPFGEATYAFIFTMEPNGLTQAHRDMMEKWTDMFRIHIPIITNRRARLISDGYAQHFEAGYAWSFDNHSRHGVVNGSQPRSHFILDVPFNDKLAGQIDRAEYVRGEKRDDLVRKIEAGRKTRASYPGDEYMGNAVKYLRGQGLDDARIADSFNAKSIPTKRYFARNSRHRPEAWDAAMVAEINLDVAPAAAPAVISDAGTPREQK